MLGAESLDEGRVGKQDLPIPWLKGTSYICPAGERLAYHYE